MALFVHGIATNAFLWHHQLSALNGRRRCVAVDLPLHGRTPVESASSLGVGGLADALEAFCLADGIDRVDLVGHDTGGAVGQVFAARHPERIRSLCLTNCDVHDSVPPEAFKPTVDLAATGAISASVPALLADPVAARQIAFGSGYEDVSRLDLELVASFLEPVLGTAERAR